MPFFCYGSGILGRSLHTWQMYPVLCLPHLSSPDIQHTSLSAFPDSHAFIVEAKKLHVRCSVRAACRMCHSPLIDLGLVCLACCPCCD